MRYCTTKHQNYTCRVYNRNSSFFIKMPPKAATKVVNTSGWDPRPWTRPGLGEEQVMEIKDAFDLFDKDRSGEITIGEMLEAMRSLGYDVEHGEAAEHVKNLDKDGSGALEFNEFYELLTARFSENTTRDELQRVFTLFDTDKTGEVSLANMRAIADMVGDNVSDDELGDIVLKNDMDNDGKLTFDDFYNVLTKKSFDQVG